MRAVACPDASHCFAVGNALLRFDGSTWARMTGALGPGGTAMSGIACPDASECWAVGSRTVGPVDHQSSVVQVTRYDGRSWSPHPLEQPGQLSAVSCPSAHDCWAVGGDRVGAEADTVVIEHWDGNRWRAAAGPTPISTIAFGPGRRRLRRVRYGELRAIACVSGDDCWAVGDDGVQFSPYAVSGATFPTLVEHFDGRAWTIAASPAVAESGPISLDGIACPDAANCWAVGQARETFTDTEWLSGLVLHWDGRHWAEDWSQGPRSALLNEPSNLSAVACTSTTDCVVAGWESYGVESFFNRAVLLRLTRSQWVDVALPADLSPPAGPGGSRGAVVGAVTCISRGACVLAGERTTIDGNVTVVLVQGRPS